MLCGKFFMLGPPGNGASVLATAGTVSPAENRGFLRFPVDDVPYMIETRGWKHRSP
jgi:hypothetical protein